MGNTVGSLVVKLSAHTAEFTSGLQKAGASAKSFGSNVSYIQGIGGNSAMMLTGVAGAALGAAKAVYELGSAFTRMAVQQAQAMVDTMRMANRMDMASEQLVALKEAAEQFGVADLIGPALSRMNAKVGQGAMGNSGAQKAFADLGLDPAALAQLDTSDKYKAIADAIQNLGNVSLQAAAAQSIFGRAGKDLIGLLSGGSEAINKAAQDTREMGTAFTDGDAAVARLATGGLREVRESIEGILNKMAVGLAPAIMEVAESITMMLQTAAPKIAEFFTWLGDNAATVFHNIQNLFKGFGDAMVGLYEFIKPVVSAMTDFFFNRINSVLSGMHSFFKFVTAGFMEIARVGAMVAADVLEAWSRMPDFLGGDKAKKNAEWMRQFISEMKRAREDYVQGIIDAPQLAGPDEKVAAARKKADDAAKQRAEMRMAPLPDLASNLSAAKWDIAKAIVVGTRDYMNMLAEMGQKKPEMDEMRKQTRLQQQIRDRLDFAEGEF